MENPGLRERIGKAGAEVAVAPSEEFGTLMRSDNSKYERLLKVLGLKE